MTFQQTVFLQDTPPCFGNNRQWQVSWLADRRETPSFPVTQWFTGAHYRIQLRGQLRNHLSDFTGFPFHPVTGTIVRAV